MLKNIKIPVVTGVIAIISSLFCLLWMLTPLKTSENISYIFGWASYSLWVFILLSILGIAASLYHLRSDEQNKKLQIALWLNTSLPLLILLYMLSNVL